MDPLAFFALVLVVLLFVGAIMGIVAKVKTTALERRLDTLTRELRTLRAALRQAEVTGAEEVGGQEVDAASSPPGAPAGPADLDLAPEAQRGPEPEPEPEPEPMLRPAAEGLPAPPPPPTPGETAPHEPVATASEPPRAAAATAGAAAPEPAAPSRPTSFAGVEQALGLRWLTWVGVALLFLGVAFFLKYAYDRDWLGRFFGPHLRIASATAVALLLAFCGWRSLRNGMAALGQGLLGGGQALLYLTIFAAFQPAVMVVETPLIGKTAAFGLMALVTAAGLVAAVRLDAIAMAFLAVLGGVAAPVMVSSGQDSRDALCAYLLLLDLGVLGVAAWRRWRALDLLAFAGTVLLFGGWYWQWHRLHPWPDAAIAWLLAFHLVFLLLPFAYHWRHRTPVTVERFALALANLAWTLAYGAWILHEPAPRLLAVGCLVGAALYLGLGVSTARRVGDDRRTRDGFLACAALLLTLGLFYLLPVDGISTAWFVEATVLLWLGYRYGNPATRHAALVVVAVALARTCVVHLPAVPAPATLVTNRWFVTLLVAGVGLGAFAWLHRRFAAAAFERGLAAACGILAGWWALAVGGLEILREAGEGVWSGSFTALAIAWLQVVGALAFLGWALRARTRPVYFAAFLPLIAAAAEVGLAYDRYPATALVVLNGACLAGLGICAALAAAAFVAGRVLDEERLREGLLGLVQLALYALATIEASAWLQRGEGPAPAVTVRQVLAWTWLASAVAGGVVAVSRSSGRVLGIAALPLALAVMIGFAMFVDDLEPHRLVANQRFVCALLCCAACVGAAALLRRLGHRRAGDQVAAIAFVLLIGYAACEAVTWSHDNFPFRVAVRWTVWLLGVVAVGGSAGGCWRARATGNVGLDLVALTTLFGAAALPLAVYVSGWDTRWMFLNLRAALVVAAIAALLWCARGSPRRGMLRWVAYAVALIALTLEPPAWIDVNVADGAEARRLSLFAVTVTWVLAASASLAVGFLRDRRPLRLIALALFALTAAKLLVLDMSGAQQLYRILAFVLVGLVFVGASWGYHRVERRLAARRAE